MERAEFDKWKPKEVARLLALVETERRYYQEIVAAIPVSILIVGAGGTLVSANRQFRARTGRKNEEILGKPIGEVLDIEDVEALARQVMESGVAMPRRDVLWRGEAAGLSVLPLRNWEEDSEPEALLVLEETAGGWPVAPDMASRIDGMIWEVDYAAGGITYASAGAEELFGYPVERWLADKTVWALRVDEQDKARVDSFYDQIAASSGIVFTIEFRARHMNGQGFWARETVRVTRDEQGKPLKLAGLTTNITERRELEQQHAVATKSAALQRLGAKLAHDLNNLLMIVAGYGEELKSALPATHPLHQDMQQILGATERLYALTAQFQTYTRRPVVNPRITSLTELLAQAAPRIEKELGHELSIRLEIEAGVAKARVDGAQMEQALLALARHALLVMGPGGRLSVHAANVLRGESTGLKTVMPAGSYVRVSLEFAGAATHGELLEPWLEPAEASREIELGVAAAYQIVRQSEGDLTVDGRSIHLYLPAVLEAEAPVSIPAPGHVAADMMAEPAPKLETILVVEDEGGIRALVRKILLRQGYDVLEAAGGDEALELLAHSGKHVDLLLTDVMMPGMNGIELSRRAVAAYSPLKVLFVSGYTDESVLEAGQFPAGTAFLQKPFTLGSLLGKVREVLDGTSARHAAS